MLLNVLFFFLLAASCRAKPAGGFVDSLVEIYNGVRDNLEKGEYGDLFEGDIENYEKNDESNINPLNAILNPNRHWPNGISHYTIQNGVYTPDQIDRIERGIQDLMDLTRVNGELCIQILPRNNEANYISVQHYSGCSSSVGRVGGSQRISLVDSCVARHGTIMHEFLHAYGFYHEQSRYDRDDHVTIVWDNIQPGHEHNFNMYTPEQITTLGSPYDYGSVLHYSAYAWAIDSSQPTIIAHDPDAGQAMGQRISLSRYDIERVQILYGCLDPRDSVYFKNYDRKTLLGYE